MDNGLNSIEKSIAPEAKHGCFTVMSTYGHFDVSFIRIHILNGIQSCIASLQFNWWLTKCNASSHKIWNFISQTQNGNTYMSITGSTIATSIYISDVYLLLSMGESDCELNCANAKCCPKHKISFVQCILVCVSNILKASRKIWNGDVIWQNINRLM